MGEDYLKAVQVFIASIAVISSIISVFVIPNIRIRVIVIIFVLAIGYCLFAYPEIAVRAYCVIIPGCTSEDNTKAPKFRVWPFNGNMPENCKKCATNDSLFVSLETFDKNSGILKVSNTSNNPIYISLLDSVTLETGKKQVSMTTSGTIAAGRSMFESTDEARANCIKGGIALGNRTIIQPQTSLRVPVRAREPNDTPEIDPASFLSVPLCFGSVEGTKGDAWFAQVSLY